MRHYKTAAAAAGLLLALACQTGIGASAYTADDVAAKARQSGWPEYLIQMGYNEWSSGAYSQEQLDKAYASVSSYNDQTKEMICNYLGVDPDDLPDADPVPAETQAPTAAAESPSSAGNDTPAANAATAPADPSSGEDAAQEPADTAADPVQPAAPAETAAPAAPAPAAGEDLIVTKTDGTQEQRVSKSEFISMSFDEKIAYVNTLEQTSKTEFVASLSTEEKNSMIKQMPTSDKAELMQSYIDTASTMGMNVTVDSLTGDNISLTVRNEEGVVIDKTNVGVVIDETGISHTKPLAAALGGILLASAGFAGLYLYTRKAEEEE